MGGIQFLRLVCIFFNFNLGLIFLANNHIQDLSDGISSTLRALARNGFTAFGAGSNLCEAANFVTISSGKQKFIILGFGWPVIGCIPATKRRPGVNRLESHQVLGAAVGSLRVDPASRLIIVIHGNYEFERYPQPAHRRLAKQLIDLGAYAVIFHHPHVVGPVERYKKRTIAYSLGNWAFSHGKFFDGRLRFPAESFDQIAVELGEDEDLVHHARFVPPNRVVYQKAERVMGADFSLKPAFEGYDDAEYLEWSKHHRIKRRGLPIYRNAADSPSNWLRDRWVGLRQVLIDTSVRSGLKSLRRRA